MTPPDDYADEMGTGTELDDRTIEDLLAGRVVDPELVELSRAVHELRAVREDCSPRPDAALASILANGLPEAAGDEQVATAAARPEARRRAPVRGLVGRLAAASVGVKLALALTSGAALAAGAAATDLPGTISETLNRGSATAPADLPPEADFGQTVGDDATDPAAPGVDGPSTATDARERGATAPDGIDGGLERAREETVDTPAAVPTDDGRLPAPGSRPDATPGGPPAGAPEAPPAAGHPRPQTPRDDAPDGPPASAPDGPPASAPDSPTAGAPDTPTAGAPDSPTAGAPDSPTAGAPESAPEGPPANNAAPDTAPTDDHGPSTQPGTTPGPLDGSDEEGPGDTGAGSGARG